MAKRKTIIHYLDSDDDEDTPATSLVGGQVVTRRAAAAAATASPPKQPKLVVHYSDNDDPDDDSLQLPSQQTEPEGPGQEPVQDLGHNEDAGDVLDLGHNETAGDQPEDNLSPTSTEFDRDTIVVQNDAVEAHIYQTLHRHQKVFQ